MAGAGTGRSHMGAMVASLPVNSCNLLRGGTETGPGLIVNLD